MATMHAPVLNELVDQALAPLDHKVQVVPIEKPASALVTDVEEAIMGPSQPPRDKPHGKSKVTMDGVLSSASVSCQPTDPAIPTPPIDYSLAPALVDVKGMHRHRFADNPEEKRFAAAFERDYGGERSNLRYLLRPASEQSTHTLGFMI